jgi:hypothetical protein
MDGLRDAATTPWEPNGNLCACIYVQVYILISESDPRLRAFTSDVTGGNLPAEYAPWRPTNGGKPMHIASPNDPIGVIIKKDGYFLVSTEPRLHPSVDEAVVNRGAC